MNNIEARAENTREIIRLAEEAAIAKVIDIHKKPSLKYDFIRFDPTDPSIDRLRENLLYDDAIQSWDGIVSKQRPVRNAFESAILRSDHVRFGKKIPREEVYTFLIKDKRLQGIVVLEGVPDNRPIISECIDFDSSSTQGTVENTVREIFSIYKDMPSRCIPVYGLSETIYWPFEQKYRPLQRYLEGERT